MIDLAYTKPVTAGIFNNSVKAIAKSGKKATAIVRYCAMLNVASFSRLATPKYDKVKAIKIPHRHKIISNDHANLYSMCEEDCLVKKFIVNTPYIVLLRLKSYFVT